MYGPHYSEKPPKISGDKWEAQTLEILKKNFPESAYRATNQVS